jgi:hypothetical protein
MYDIILFSIFILPFTIKKFKNTTKNNYLPLIINFIIVFLLFIYFFEEFRTQLWIIYENGFNSFFDSSDSLPFSKVYYNIIRILFFLLCFYISGLTLNLGLLKERSRKLFLKTILPIWIILVNYFYQLFLIRSIDYSDNKVIIMIISGLLIGVPFLILYIIYSSKKFKFIFNTSNT